MAGLCACPEGGCSIKINHFTSFFFFFPGKVGVRGECVDKATAAKAESIEEDLEDVFHNCTRSP